MEIAISLIASIITILIFGKDIVTFIKRKIKPDDAHSVDEITNEVIDYSHFIEEKTKDFVGRKFVFDVIEQFTEDNPRGYFIIRGEPGIGKSAFAAYFVKNKKCPHHFNIRAEAVGKGSNFLKNICVQLILKYNLDRSIFLSLEVVQKGRVLSEVLEKSAQKASSKILIMIDALDEIDEAEFTRGVNPLYLPKILPDNVYVVITTRPLGDKSPRLSIECEHESFTIDWDSANNKADVREYLEKTVIRPGIQNFINAHDIDNENFINHLSEKSQGNFMYLRYVIPDIEKGIYTDQVIPKGLINYYEDHWQRMCGQDEDAWAKYKLPIIVALTAVRNPISIDLIAKYSKISSEQSRIVLVLEEWREFLYETEVPYQGGLQKRYRLYHKSFYDFLVKKIDLKSKHSDISDVLLGDFFK